ncbi:YcgL domain-containing protein, partial [uncultured Methylophaga sp.]
MKAYIYKSRKKEELYLYLSKKDDFSEVPPSLYGSMGNEPIFVMELELSPDRKLAREDVNKVIHNLETQGFHVQ